jgi:hypothetical protein
MEIGALMKANAEAAKGLVLPLPLCVLLRCERRIV